MIVPNEDRVLVKKVDTELMQDDHILLPGQLKSGENLFVGEVVHKGDSKLHIGQLVWFSEFSNARIIDMGKVLRGEWTVDEAIKSENLLYILAKDDIMAYDDDYDFVKIREAAQKSKPEAAPAV